MSQGITNTPVSGLTQAETVAPQGVAGELQPAPTPTLAQPWSPIASAPRDGTLILARASADLWRYKNGFSPARAGRRGERLMLVRWFQFGTVPGYWSTHSKGQGKVTREPDAWTHIPGDAEPFAHFQWNSGWEVWEQVNDLDASRDGVLAAHLAPGIDPASVPGPSAETLKARTELRARLAEGEA